MAANGSQLLLYAYSYRTGGDLVAVYKHYVYFIYATYLYECTFYQWRIYCLGESTGFLNPRRQWLEKKKIFLVFLFRTLVFAVFIYEIGPREKLSTFIDEKIRVIRRDGLTVIKERNIVWRIFFFFFILEISEL